MQEFANHSITSPTRFVVLRHDQRKGIHYDVMIESGSVLATWKTADPPETAGECPLDCTWIGDHRPLYLEYEGPISGDRGVVSRHDRGTCEVLSRGDDFWDVRFHGSLLKGRFALQRVDASVQLWSLRFLTA